MVSFVLSPLLLSLVLFYHGCSKGKHEPSPALGSPFAYAPIEVPDALRARARLFELDYVHHPGGPSSGNSERSVPTSFTSKTVTQTGFGKVTRNRFQFRLSAPDITYEVCYTVSRNFKGAPAGDEAIQAYMDEGLIPSLFKSRGREVSVGDAKVNALAKGRAEIQDAIDQHEEDTDEKESAPSRAVVLAESVWKVLKFSLFLKHFAKSVYDVVKKDRGTRSYNTNTDSPFVSFLRTQRTNEIRELVNGSGQGEHEDPVLWEKLLDSLILRGAAEFYALISHINSSPPSAADFAKITGQNPDVAKKLETFSYLRAFDTIFAYNKQNGEFWCPDHIKPPGGDWKDIVGLGKK